MSKKDMKKKNISASTVSTDDLKNVGGGWYGDDTNVLGLTLRESVYLKERGYKLATGQYGFPNNWYNSITGEYLGWREKMTKVLKGGGFSAVGR